MWLLVGPGQKPRVTSCRRRARDSASPVLANATKREAVEKRSHQKVARDQEETRQEQQRESTRAWMLQKQEAVQRMGKEKDSRQGTAAQIPGPQRAIRESCHETSAKLQEEE